MGPKNGSERSHLLDPFSDPYLKTQIIIFIFKALSHIHANSDTGPKNGYVGLTHLNLLHTTQRQ